MAKHWTELGPGHWLEQTQEEWDADWGKAKKILRALIAAGFTFSICTTIPDITMKKAMIITGVSMVINFILPKWLSRLYNVIAIVVTFKRMDLLDPILESIKSIGDQLDKK